MDVKSGYPFWAVKNGLLKAYPRLRRSVACDVVVVGAGITGAVIADRLAAAGHSVVVVDKRDIAWGSTSASTSLLQYENDEYLVDLADKFGSRSALGVYRACVDSVQRLGELAAGLRGVGFAAQESLYYASNRWQLRAVRKEFEYRDRHGFDVRWLDRGQLSSRYGLLAPGAILSKTAARMDPYRMAHRLLARVKRAGGAVYDHTCVESIATHRGGVSLTTSGGGGVEAAFLVVAAGYEAQCWLDEPVAKNRSSYAFASDPMPEALGAFANTLVWESARPYLYFRSTEDGRLMVGGADDDHDDPVRRDRRVGPKQAQLLEQLHARVPRLQPECSFAWAGTFAETDDGLPYFGAHPQWGPRVLFAMAYGGNGIVYSLLGADLIQAQVERRSHRLSRLFSFQRG